MKRIHYAWIEQILSFDSAEERTAYVQVQKEKAARKNQPEIQVMDYWVNPADKRFMLQIRKPYNHNPMATN